MISELKKKKLTSSKSDAKIIDAVMTDCINAVSADLKAVTVLDMLRTIKDHYPQDFTVESAVNKLQLLTSKSSRIAKQMAEESATSTDKLPTPDLWIMQQVRLKHMTQDVITIFDMLKNLTARGGDPVQMSLSALKFMQSSTQNAIDKLRSYKGKNASVISIITSALPYTLLQSSPYKDIMQTLQSLQNQSSTNLSVDQAIDALTSLSLKASQVSQEIKNQSMKQNN